MCLNAMRDTQKALEAQNRGEPWLRGTVRNDVFQEAASEPGLEGLVVSGHTDEWEPREQGRPGDTGRAA